MDRLTATMRSPPKGGMASEAALSRSKSSASARLATPQRRLLPRGSLGSLRRLRSRLSLGSLRKGSPEKKGATRLGCHVTESSSVHSQHSFRPLSIVKSALRPFDFDVAAAMEAAQNHPLSSPPASPKTSMASGQDGTEPLARIPRLSNEEREDDEKTIKPERQTSSSPHPSACETEVSGDFRSLVRLPPPDIRQHPAFASDPMTSTSDAPLMVTTTTEAEIRQWAQERRPNMMATQAGTTSRAGATTPHRGLRFVTPTGLRRREAQANPEAPAPSGFSLRKNFSRLRLEYENAVFGGGDIFSGGASMTSPTPGLKTPAESEKQATTPGSQDVEQKKTGLRKVTGLFKSKPEKAQPDPVSPLPDGPNYRLPRQDLERYLRITSNCRSYDYDETQPYPRHPNTGRAWHSRNLKCTNCLDVTCAVCGRTCCAYKAASEALENHQNNAPSLMAAQDRLADISNLFPFGRETTTFLQCTHGGGCGKMKMQEGSMV
ncbi:hypothetical protein KCU88_g3171, partial [Aureobasidium melanogenum]